VGRDSLKIAQRKTSLRGLRLFCVAAKYASYKLAAEELSLTASAISQQVKSLEEELGTELFIREKRALRLTHQGERLYRRIEPLITKIDDAIADAMQDAAKRQLRLSVQPFFASESFVPELEDFTRRHPKIEIYVDTSDESAERHPASADASIRLFRQPPSHLCADPLFPLRLIPACSPAFLKQYKVDGDARRPFPIVVHSSRPEAWKIWTRVAGVDLPAASNVVRLDSMIAVARAAERGVGAALVPVPLSDNWFKYGALVPMFETIVEMPEAYYLVYSPDKADTHEVTALREWVLEVFEPFRRSPVSQAQVSLT
jgi:LysR family glycine cleavage system transcriptional activator